MKNLSPYSFLINSSDNICVGVWPTKIFSSSFRYQLTVLQLNLILVLLRISNIFHRRQRRRPGSIFGLGRCPGEGNGYRPTPVFLPGESHGQKSLMGYNLWGHKELDRTEQLIMMLPGSILKYTYIFTWACFILKNILFIQTTNIL